jgi:hypothetical protein
MQARSRNRFPAIRRNTGDMQLESGMMTRLNYGQADDAAHSQRTFPSEVVHDAEIHLDGVPGPGFRRGRRHRSRPRRFDPLTLGSKHKQPFCFRRRAVDLPTSVAQEFLLLGRVDSDFVIHGDAISELTKKPDVILKEQPDVVDLVAPHAEAFDPEAERETGHGLGVVAYAA